MFTYLPLYRVLVCQEHCYAVYNLDEHLKRLHKLPSAERRRLIASYSGLALSPPERVPAPEPYGPPVAELGAPQSAFLCCQAAQQGADDNHPDTTTTTPTTTSSSSSNRTSCSFITTSYTWIKKHTNQQHSTQLSRWSTPSAASYEAHAGQLWKPVQVQTFFAERRYVRYFIVREEQGQEQGQEQEKEQGNKEPGREEDEQGAAEEEDGCKQTLARLSHEWQALEREESKAMEHMAEEASAKDRTGWFKRTQWDEHLQAYPSWRLLAYAIRMPGKEEPQLQRAVQLVEELVEDAVQGLSTLSLETLRWLRSAQAQEINVRPFSCMQNPSSQLRAARLWARLICYCLRTVAAEAAEAEGEVSTLGAIARLFPWHGKQKLAATRLWELLNSNSSDSSSSSSSERMAKQRTYVLRLSQQLICHKLHHRPFSSGLVHFLAALGINPETNRLRTAPEYSPMLGSLVYCVQALAVETFLPASQREAQGAAETQSFLQQRASYLVDGSYSPMSIMLSLLSYAEFIALRTPGAIAGSMWWSLDRQTFFIKGRPVELERFRTMAQGVVAEAERLLWEELLWVGRKEDRPAVELSTIQDDITVVRRGASFLPPSRLQQGRQWTLARLASLPAAQKLYHPHVRAAAGQGQEQGQEQEQEGGSSPGPVRWRERRVRQFVRQIERFLELLCLAVHVTGGQPARGPELLSVRWRNGVLQDRNLYVMEGQVVVITRYHKLQAQWDQPRVVARFLPDRLGQLLAAYLLYVRPLQTMLASSLDKLGPASSQDYVWAGSSGPWETDRLTRTMTLETAARLGTRLTTQEYRHTAVGIGREVVGERFAAGYNKQLGSSSGGGAYDNPDMMDHSRDEDGEDPLELQNGRSTAVGNVAYAVQADLVQGLSIRSTDVFRTLSHAWHAFLGFPPHKGRETVLGKRASDNAAPAREQEQEQEQQQLLKRAKTAQQALAAPTATTYSSNSSAWNRDAATEEAVRKVLGILPSCPVTYKSPDQERALEAIVRGVSPLIVVLPTGGGKTLFPMAAAMLDSSQQADQPRVTILVLPFRALIEDMLVRLQEAGITAAEWQPGAHNELENRRTPASVVLVSADHASSSNSQFLSYAALLAQQQILCRVVVDECHTAITADSWRPRLTKLRDVRLLPCQLVLLTATLPPSREAELRKALLVPTATTVRAETTQRAGTQYAVVQCPEQRELAERAVRLARRLMEEARAAYAAAPAPAHTGAAASAAGKGIVYCRSRRLCERLAALLDCPAYHAGVASRTELLQAWRQQGGLIVSTSALGVGVDIPYVWFTLHVEQPWSMVDFVQESGRARAQGKAVILAVQRGQRCGEGEEGEGEEEEEEAEGDSLAMAAFVRATSCRRAVMSQYMDGVPVCCRELQGRATAGGEEVASCDNCERRTAEEQEQEQQQQQQQQQPGSGQAAWQEATQLQAVQEQLVCAKLTELAQSTCPYCWAILHEVFDGERRSSVREAEEQEMWHSIWQCPRLNGAQSVREMDEVRRWVRYCTEDKMCWKCGVTQELCEKGRGKEIESKQGGECLWANVVVPVLYGLREAGRAKAQIEGSEACRTTTVLGRAGYREGREERSSRSSHSNSNSNNNSNSNGNSNGNSYSRTRAFGSWIGASCVGGRVLGRRASKGFQVVVEAVLKEEEKEEEEKSKEKAE